MKISKALFYAVVAAALIIVCFISYKITINKLGGKDPATSAPENSASAVSEYGSQTSVKATEMQSAVASESVIGTQATTAENTDDATQNTASAGVTAAAVTSVAGSSVLPDPIIVKVDENSWNLTLMNKWYKVDPSYTPTITEAVPGSGEYLDSRVTPHYYEMYKAAAAEGVDLSPCSGYRSIDRQTRNYNNLVSKYESQGYSKTEAQAEAAKSIMVPGHSEHNYGLAMDIGWVDNSFASSTAYAWLNKHAAEYGFIERYTQEKSGITGVIPESWHWRYVGVDAANAMKASGQCLEEYLGKVN